MKFKHLFFAAALFSIAPLFCACNDDDNEIEVPRDPEEDPSSQPDTTPEATSPTEATGLYVINASRLNYANGMKAVSENPANLRQRFLTAA